MDPDVGGSSPLIHPIFIAPVAQLDRAADFGSARWGFESSQARQLINSLPVSSYNLFLYVIIVLNLY